MAQTMAGATMAQREAATSSWTGATTSWRTKLGAATVSVAAILLVVFSHHPGESNRVHYGKSYPVPSDAGTRGAEPSMQGTSGGLHYQHKTPIGEKHQAARKPSFRVATRIAEQELIVQKLLAQEGSLVQAGEPILLVKIGEHSTTIKAASTGVLKHLVSVSPGGTVVAEGGKLFDLAHPQGPMSPIFIILLLIFGGLGTWFLARYLQSVAVAENDDEENAQEASGSALSVLPRESAEPLAPGYTPLASLQVPSQPLATVHEDSVPLLSANFRLPEPSPSPHEAETEMLKREATEASTEAPLTSRSWDRELTELSNSGNSLSREFTDLQHYEGL